MKTLGFYWILDIKHIDRGRLRMKQKKTGMNYNPLF
jgi:hypothetical protein